MKCPHCGTKMVPYEKNLDLWQCPKDFNVEPSEMKKLIYLASPYSHKDPLIVLKRVGDTSWATAKLIENGHLIFSPICHSHHMAHLVKFDPLNHAPDKLTGWMAYDFAFIEKADEVWVLMQDGWKDSHGIAAEIAHAQQCSTPIRYVSFPDLEVLNEEYEPTR